MIQKIDKIQSAFGQRPKSSQQNGLLGNKLGNFKSPEKLDLEELSTKMLIDWENMKTEARMHGRWIAEEIFLVFHSF